MELFFDTETTGKGNFKLPHTHLSQPHLVQLACILSTHERIYATVNILVKPGVMIPADAQKVHGISDDDVTMAGVETIAAVQLFAKMAAKAHRVVAHNLQYDRLVMMNAAHRCNYKLACFDLPSQGTAPEGLCTMLSAKNVCKLPGMYGDFKWPTLDEAYRHIVDQAGFTGAHDALVDVTACRALYYRMVQRGEIR